MSDETTPAQAAETDPEVESTPETQDAPADTIDALPDWAQKMVKELRSENAKHRKAKTVAEQAAEQAAITAAAEQGKFKELWEKSQAELEQTKQAKQAAELSHLRSQIAAKHKLPTALAERLRGETEEDLEADALTLLEAIPQPTATLQTDAAQGSNGDLATPGMDDRAIQEMASIYGVSVAGIKKYLGIQQ